MSMQPTHYTPATTRFTREGVQLFLGNCLDILPQLPDSSVDCIITDPYSLHSTNRSRRESAKRKTIADEAAMLDAVLGLTQHVLKENSHIYVFTDWQAFTPLADMVQKHFSLTNVLVWEQQTKGSGGDLLGDYASQHQLILFAQKGQRQLTNSGQPNVLTFAAVPNSRRHHPDEKPVSLLQYLITQSTAPGDTVLDMFMGSGSMCLAAYQLQRKAIGIEIKKDWFDVAQRRLAERV